MRRTDTSSHGCAGLDGKFLKVGGRRFLVRGVSYGTFAPDRDGLQFPEGRTIARDFAMMRAAAINTVRLYTPPPLRLLELAAAQQLRVMIGLPWAQHIAFLAERDMQREIRRQIVRHVRAYAGEPATLLFALGNEIHPSVVRWHGHRAVERFLHDLYDAAKNAAPEALFTYVNYPPTEYLDVSIFDVCSFNVYLHDEDRLRAYLARMQHIAGHKPLLVAEAGADSIRHGEQGQARLTAMQVQSALSEGACGVVAFAWTDEWWRGGEAIHNWAFGLVDTRRRPKPALQAVQEVFASAEPHRDEPTPRVSVVVCAYNARDTIDECLTSLEALTYPDFEVIVVNDGSTDRTASRIARHPFARVIHVQQAGLSNARNVGLQAATGEIVAYCDADVRVDPQWLDFLVRPFTDPNVAGSGGPNVVPPDDPWMAQCVARAPGGPTHVLLTDHAAEHIPGCNMAFRRDALLKIGGFNPIFRRAGDDVDLCWRLQAHCGRIGFAPAALVWHRHRASVRAYWRQQVGYGEGEVWLQPLHPDKFVGRHILWRGLVYSPLPFVRSLFDRRINTGVWGSAPFPSVYRTDANPSAYLPHSAGWQTASLALIVLAAILALWDRATALVFLAAGLGGLTVTAAKCFSHACASDLASLPPITGLSLPTSRFIYRIVISYLHFLQPLARLHGRVRGRLHRPEPAIQTGPAAAARPLRLFSLRELWDAVQLMSGRSIELRFWSESWTNNSDLLTRVVSRLRASRVAPRIEVDQGWWTDRDISIAIGPLARLDVQTLVEDHGAGKCLFRANVRLCARWLKLFVALLGTAGVAAGWAYGDLLGRLAIALALLIAAVVIAVAVQVSHGSGVVRDTIRMVAAQFAMQALAPPPRRTARMGMAFIDVYRARQIAYMRTRQRTVVPTVVRPRRPLGKPSAIREPR